MKKKSQTYEIVWFHKLLLPAGTDQNLLVCKRLTFFSLSLYLSGLGSLFSGPDLSGISDQPLTVTGIRHASTIELSEEGVEASATTVVTSMRSVSMFSVNSPFLFALVDDASLTPLFMGIVTNPAPDNPMLNDESHNKQSYKPISGNGNGTIDFPEFWTV